MYSVTRDRPSREDLYNNFNRLAAPNSVNYFDDEHEKNASEFI